MRSFTIEVSGHRFRGAWRPDGKEWIEVRCDYGRQLAPLRGRNAPDVARAVLAEMVPHPEPRR